MRLDSVPGRRADPVTGRRARRLLPLVAAATLLSGGRATGADPTDDGIPAGAVAFFLTSGACPTGWSAAPSAEGRLLIGTQAGKDVGVQVGAALMPEEDRVHVHSYYTQVSLPYKSISAADGGNNQAAAAGTLSIPALTAPAATGLPFIQLVVCEHK